MKIHFQFLSVMLLILLGSLIACVSNKEGTAAGQVVDLPSVTHIDLVRLADGELLVQTDYWEFYSLQKGEFREITLPEDPLCSRRTDYYFPTGLPDGRIGLLERCLGRWPNRVPGKDNADYVVAYDWESGELEKLVKIPDLNALAYRFSWNPGMTRGVQEIGLLRGTISWITVSGLTPMTVTIGSGDKSWSLDENFESFEAIYDDDVGIARRPTWSPDGESIAFWASTSVIGRSGHARARGNYSLYLLAPDMLELHSILDNVSDPEDLVWSPDSNWLLFQAEVDGRGGLWLISRDGSTVPHVDRVPMKAWNWINNQEILVIHCLDARYPCEKTTLIKYNISDI